MMINNSEEIDLINPLKELYRSRKLILYYSLISVLIGISLAFILPVKFNSTTVFIPQNQEVSKSSLLGVASLVGINLGSSSMGNQIPPSMYPQIIESVKFKRQLLNKIIDKKNNLTLKNFIVEHYSLEEDKEVNISELEMTSNEEKYFKILSDYISVNVNARDGFVSISSEMPIAEYSAKITKFSREILQNIIIDNNIESARQNLIFSEKQLKEKKDEFDQIYSKLAFYKDSNLNSVNSFVLNEKNKLESEFEIISAVVEELSKQVEQAKLQLKKDTPVFSTIQEAHIPVKRTSPKRAILVIVFGFFGFIFGCAFILIKKPLTEVFFEIKDS